jgi:hypothetical protein
MRIVPRPSHPVHCPRGTMSASNYIFASPIRLIDVTGPIFGTQATRHTLNEGALSHENAEGIKIVQRSLRNLLGGAKHFPLRSESPLVAYRMTAVAPNPWPSQIGGRA